MADETRGKQVEPWEELNQGQESNAKPKPEPQPNLEEAKKVILQEKSCALTQSETRQLSRAD